MIKEAFKKKNVSKQSSHVVLLAFIVFSNQRGGQGLQNKLRVDGGRWCGRVGGRQGAGCAIWLVAPGHTFSSRYPAAAKMLIKSWTYLLFVRQ